MLSRLMCKRLVSIFNPRSEFCNGSRQYVSIPDFYSGKSVLITGATGFLGQGLVEKLLRSCPDIGNIYVSVRPDKNGKTERKFRTFLKNEIFQVLRETDPSFTTKIIPFRGDITQQNMGMDKNAMSRICEDVSVILHCAADIRLNPSLKDSIEGNVLGSKNVYEFGKKCPNLCAYVHVSTTYSNYNLDHVEEKIYSASGTPDELIRLAQNHEDEYIRKNNKYLDKKHVSYTFCKKAAENILVDDCNNENTAVFRSCFISPSLSEPFPYWKVGQAGYVLILNSISKGVLPYLHGDPGNPIEMLPVDMIVNSLISVGWYLGTGRHGHTSNHVYKGEQDHADIHSHTRAHGHTSKHGHTRTLGQTWTNGNTNPLVVNVNSSTDNAVTLSDLEQAVKGLYGRNGEISFKIIPNRYVHFCMVVVPAFLQATLKDISALMKGEQPKNISRLRKLFKGLKWLEASALRHPVYDFNNAKLIHEQLSESDKRIFPFDVKSINWESYLSEWLMKLREENQSERTKTEYLQAKEDASVTKEDVIAIKEDAIVINEDANTTPIPKNVTLRN